MKETEPDYLESNYPTLETVLFNAGCGFELMRKLDSTDVFYLVAEDEYYHARLTKEDILNLAKELVRLVNDERGISLLAKTLYDE